MKIQGIYSICHTASGRVYVGSSIHIHRRFNTHRLDLNHKRHVTWLLQLSWNKHGADAFTFSIIEVVEDRSDLIAREQHWIDTLNAACPKRGFNTRGAEEGRLSFKHRPAAVELIRNGQLRAWATKARRDLATQILTEQMKDPIRRAQIGEWSKSKDGLDWITKRNRTWWSDEKNREDMRNKAKERCTPEFMAKCRAAGMGKLSREHYEAHRARLTLRMSDPVERVRMAAAVSAYRMQRTLSRIENFAAEGRPLTRGLKAAALRYLVHLSPVAAAFVAERRHPQRHGPA